MDHHTAGIEICLRVLQSCENIGAGFLDAAIRRPKQDRLVGDTTFLKRLSAEVAIGISHASIAAYCDRGMYKTPTQPNAKLTYCRHSFGK